LAGGVSELHNCVASTAELVVSSSSTSSCLLGNVTLSGGSSLSLGGDVRTLSNAALGERVLSADEVEARKAGVGDGSVDGTDTALTMQPLITLLSTAVLTVGADCTGSLQSCDSLHTRVSINARLNVLGSVMVEADSTLALLQGADMSSSDISIASGGVLELAGYASRLSTYDSYELQVSQRGIYVGEWSDNLAQEELNEHSGVQIGVYRIALSALGASGAPTQTTSCIPYNATETTMKNILDALGLVQERGLTTVRRYGGDSAKYQFGYTYRIEMDATPTTSFSDGPLTAVISCYGLDCSCAETMVQLIDATGMPSCPKGADYSLADPLSCVVTPIITIAQLSTLSHTATAGEGVISVSAGVHRLPPVSALTLAVTAGVGVAAADTLTWYGLSVGGVGRMIIAGTGWLAWDASDLLYTPDWTYEREFSYLDFAPPFSLSSTYFDIGGNGAFLASCPHSNISWDTGTWSGGVIGGRATFFLAGVMDAGGSNKALRHAATLFVSEGAVIDWTSGNLSLANGADLIIEGTLRVNTSDRAPVFVGMAQLLQAPDTAGQALLYQTPGRNWNDYFGDELDAELRTGWYRNPLCGGECLDTNHLTVQAAGVVDATSTTEVTFSLPLDLIGQSRLNMGFNVSLDIASGGICGNDVIIDITSGTTLELSGGRMLMQATCTIQGEGELLVTAGSHDLSFSIDAHITINGGSMVWPESNGPEQTITFNGGLLIENTGELQVNPFSTTILVNNGVHLKDQGLIQFPLIGIAAQASLFDEQDAPDPAPRGNLISTGIMRLDGGTLRGKADFTALDALFLDGDNKNILSLAKLVNRGHCEWGTGDLITVDSGDFLNQGTVQMMDGVAGFFSNGLYAGTELPVESGGDVFALEYHSWDMDNGGLDYTEYVRQRTEFVSRAPNGWTSEDQNGNRRRRR